MTATPQQAHQWMWAAHEALRSGRIREAAQAYARAVEVFAAAADRAGEGEARANLGQALLALGHHDAARTELSSALALAQLTDSVPLEAAVASALGALHLDHGDPAAAAPLLQRALVLAEAGGVRQRAGGARLGLASLHRDRGELALAAALVAAAQGDAAATWDERLGFAAEAARAGLDLEEGDAQSALVRWVALAGRSRGPVEEAARWSGLGSARLALLVREGGSVEPARDALEAAWQGFADLHDPLGTAACRRRLVVVEALLGDRDEATGHLVEARALVGTHPVQLAALAVAEGHLAVLDRQVALRRGDLSALTNAELRLADALAAATPWQHRSARVRSARSLLVAHAPVRSEG